VTLVTRDDTRLVADIEQLIKKKIELEPVELEDDRPRRPPRREPAFEERAAPRPSSSYGRPSAPSHDPFFDRPYVAGATSTPSWDTATPTTSTRGLSPNIRSRRKVAALLSSCKV
jgi:hypothetical protein